MHILDTIDTGSKKIGDAGLIKLAEILKLADCVVRDLELNEIGQKGIKALTQVRLKEGVYLNLNNNKI